jgi:uncharacterized lipoprotein YmbA
MSGFQLRLVVAWFLIAGAGCTSAPVHYYTLTPRPEALPSETALAIDVRIIHTPPQLNRSELIIRTGPAEVTLLENERWASPVKDEIRDALRLELQRRLGRMGGLRTASAKLTLDLDVQHFEAELGRHTLIEVSWNATLSALGPRPDGARPDGPRETRCTFHADEEIQAGYAGIVEGYQREIAALADAIAAVLTNAFRGADAPCR